MTTEHISCPECGSGEFWLLPDGRIACADDECCAKFGNWIKAAAGGRPAALTATPEGSRP